MRSQILRKDATVEESPASFSREAAMTEAMSAMMICQWAAIFFMAHVTE